MGKPKLYEIVFSNSHAVYSAGGTVSGHVLFILKEPLKMRALSLELTGRGKVHWKDNTGRSGRVVYFSGEEEYFHKKIILFGGGAKEDVVHPTGEYTYPFQLDLPSDLPSSFEGTFGFVRYFARSVVDIRMKRDFVIKSAFTVLSILDLNKEPTELQVPVRGRSESEVSCCWRISGQVSAKFELKKRGYVPGEEIAIFGQIQNGSTAAVKKSTITLKQCVEFFGVPDTMFSSKEPRSFTEENCIASIELDPVEPEQTRHWNDLLLEIPPIPPSRLDGCNIINITYAVEFNVAVKYGADLTLVGDIVIGTVPFCDIEVPHDDLDSKTVTKQPIAHTTTTLTTVDTDDNNDLKACNKTNSAFRNITMPMLNFAESNQGRVNIREEGESRFTKGKLYWAPVYVTYKMGRLVNHDSQNRLHQQQQQPQEKEQ